MSLTRIVPDCHFATVESPATVSESLTVTAPAGGDSFRTGWTEKQDDSQIDETNKNYLRNTDNFKANLRNTDHFKVFTLDERLRDSPVPCQCRAGVSSCAGYGLRNVWQTSAGQWPARPAESRRRDWNELDGAGTVEMFEKIPVLFEKNTAIFEGKMVLLYISSSLS